MASDVERLRKVSRDLASLESLLWVAELRMLAGVAYWIRQDLDRVIIEAQPSE